MPFRRCYSSFLSLLVIAIMVAGPMCLLADNGELQMHLRWQERIPAEKEKPTVFQPKWEERSWQANETAIIVCDMWDSHHCYNAVRRVKNLAPRMNQVLEQARERGVLIIHAPSDCTGPYANHPARQRAQSAPAAANLPAEIDKWCDRIPAEEEGTYPIDQSDGGEDDDPESHKQWHAELESRGRKPTSPWLSQIDLLRIDERDAISDSGVEIWNLLEARQIKHVILLGVHTNMCVLGRPFGLRQMSKNGRDVVLMRDMTDTMYNPARPPHVNHHTGTDYIVEHIEKYVCPTVLSTDIVGGKPFRFFDDGRPRLALVISEFEYETPDTLPEFARQSLGKDFRVEHVINRDINRHDLPSLEVLDEADVLVLSMWRRALPDSQLHRLREFLEQGKAVVAIRTSSHAFMTRDGVAPAGHQLWPEFDRQILGGHYTGHYGNRVEQGNAATRIWPADKAHEHPIMHGFPVEEISVPSWLYKIPTLTEGAQPLLWGKLAGGNEREPVAWTFHTPAGGRVFYTSLGHPQDFQLPEFQRLLTNAIFWAAGRDVPK